MKIKFINSHPAGLKVDQVKDLPLSLAWKWIADGYAVPYDENPDQDLEDTLPPYQPESQYPENETGPMVTVEPRSEYVVDSPKKKGKK